MYYYTDNENIRFLAWIRAKPNDTAKTDNFFQFQFEVSRLEKK